MIQNATSRANATTKAPAADSLARDDQIVVPAPAGMYQSARTKGTLIKVWTPLSQYSVVVDISAVVPRKLAAIRCHVSQLADLDYAHAAQSLNAYRGVMASRTAFAEVFETFPD